MASHDSLMGMPAEIRLDIYERILHFDYPLRRLKPIEELDGTLEDDLRQYVRGEHVNVSILFACRKTYDEALPILYRLNTMSLCHDDVCTLSRKLGFTRCKSDLLTSIVVVDWLECTPWTVCKECSTESLSFLSAFNNSFFPKLRTLTLDFELFKGGYAALGEQLIKAGVDVTFTFTAVGCLTISTPVGTPTVNFTYNTIAATWWYYSRFPAEHKELRRRSRVTKQLEGIDERFVRYVREIIWMYHEYVASKESQAALVESQAMLRGVDVRWLDPEKQGSGTYEKLTDKLIQRLEALARRR